jgi:hypothetical protein
VRSGHSQEKDSRPIGAGVVWVTCMRKGQENLAADSYITEGSAVCTRRQMLLVIKLWGTGWVRHVAQTKKEFVVKFQSQETLAWETSLYKKKTQ